MDMIKFVTLFGVLSVVSGTYYLVTDQIYLDVEHNSKFLGRITVGLFGEVTPKTVKNFIQIATTGINGTTYAESIFHRVIPRFIIQGGDILNKNGTGSISIYGKYFEDENFEVKHTEAGFLGMANAGKDKNGCQFYITTITTPWLDNHHTIFGKVVQGQDIVHRIEHLKTDSDDHPLKDVIIKKSGLISTKSFYVSDELYDIWDWIHASVIPLSMSLTILGTFQWMIGKLDI